MRTTTSWSKLLEASAETGPALGDFSGVPIGTIPVAKATMQRRAHPRMWNLVFSNQNGSILTEARNESDRTHALSTTNTGQRRIVTHRAEFPSDDAIQGEIA